MTTDTTAMMQAGIEKLAGSFPGPVGVVAVNLVNGERIEHNPDVVFPTASTIKVGIMAHLYEAAAAGRVDLEARMPVTDGVRRGGTGVLREFSPGLEPTVRDACRMMIVVSDNTATKMVVELLGVDAINASLRGWGLPTMRLRYEDMAKGEDNRKYAESSPRDLARLMELIATDAIVSPGACAEMREHLLLQQHGEQIPRTFPYSRYRYLSGEPEPLRVMNKIGCMDGMRADVALVETPGSRWVLATMNEGSPDTNFHNDHEGNVLNGAIGRIVLDGWSGYSPA